MKTLKFKSEGFMLQHSQEHKQTIFGKYIRSSRMCYMSIMSETKQRQIGPHAHQNS
jgi:hypothetical protein